MGDTLQRLITARQGHSNLFSVSPLLQGHPHDQDKVEKAVATNTTRAPNKPFLAFSPPPAAAIPGPRADTTSSSAVAEAAVSMFDELGCLAFLA